MSAPLVELTGLGRVFAVEGGDVVALAGIDLQIARGERLAIVGPSGSGKSTLLNVLGAIDRGYGGSARIDGHELRALNDRGLARLRNQCIGFVFQTFNLLPNLSVGDNLTLPAAFSDLPRPEAERRARELLARVGLASTWSQRPLELSGGQRQRVAVARALLLRPSLLLCDEPTGSLDAAHADAVLDLFDELCAATGCALVVVTHDPRVEVRLPRRLRLEAGRLVEDVRREAMP